MSLPKVTMTKWEIIKVYWIGYAWGLAIIGAFIANVFCNCLGATQPFQNYTGEGLAVFMFFAFSMIIQGVLVRRFKKKKLGIKDKKINDYYFKVDDHGVMRAYDKETNELLT